MTLLSYLWRRANTRWSGQRMCPAHLCGRPTMSWVYKYCGEHAHEGSLSLHQPPP